MWWSIQVENSIWKHWTKPLKGVEVVIEFTIKSPSKFDIRWFKVCWFRICNKKYTNPCSFLREKCYKKYIFHSKTRNLPWKWMGNSHQTQLSDVLARKRTRYHPWFFYMFIIILNTSKYQKKKIGLPYYFSQKMRKTGYF